MPRLAGVLVLIAGLMLPTPTLRAHAVQQQPTKDPAADPQNTEQLVDTYITVMTVAYPEVGVALGAAKGIMSALGYFNKPDTLGLALSRINQRLDALEARMQAVESQLTDVRNDLRRQQNLERVRHLRTLYRTIREVLFDLQHPAPDRQNRLVPANRAQLVVNEFLDDADLWLWSDTGVTRDGREIVLEKDFKPLPALEYYAGALVAWMAAVEYATGGDGRTVKTGYGKELQRHIDFLRERPRWNQLTDAPQTLPENVRVRVRTEYSPSQYPERGVCRIAETAIDRIGRSRQLVRTFDVAVSPAERNSFCAVPSALVDSTASGETEDALERAYGVDLMTMLADELERLRSTGHFTGAETTGTFDPAQYTGEYLYAVNADGDLLWFTHRAALRPSGTASPGATEIQGQARVGTRIVERAGQRRGSGTTLEPAGRGYEPRAMDPANTPAPPSAARPDHVMDGPKRVGGGWQRFKDVIPGGQSAIYALGADGTLTWMRHDGLVDGTDRWTGPVVVGSGWNSFVRIVPAGDGVLYGITPDGTLKWYRHDGYIDGSVRWSGPIDVGTGWAQYRHVFAGGQGVLYTVRPDGVLEWRRHTGYLTGAPQWEATRGVGTSWQSFDRVFSPGDGFIYARKPDGELLWYRHDGYADGTPAWRGPATIATDWNAFLFVFPRMIGTPKSDVR